MVEFPVTSGTSTGATMPASSSGTTTTTTAAAPVSIDPTDEKQTDTPATAPGGNAPGNNPSSGSATGVSIFVAAAAVLAYFS